MLQVDFVIGHNTVQLLFHRKGICKIGLAAWSHVATNHDAIDGLGWVGDRYIYHQYSLTILAKNIPDGLTPLTVSLDMCPAWSSLHLLLLVFPKVIHAMCGRFHTR